MDTLQRQNQQLQKQVQELLDSIQKQKELNNQHQQQIATLLSFNQRLLLIIEKEVTNPNKDNCSLQPISERSERESDLNIHMLLPTNNLRAMEMARSEKGQSTTKSQIYPKNYSGNKLDIFRCEVHKSEYSDSLSEKVSDKSMKRHFKQVNVASDKLRNEMKTNLQEFKHFKDQSRKFYQNKIQEVRAIGEKVKKFNPAEQLNRITEKLNLRTSTSNLIKKMACRQIQ